MDAVEFPHRLISVRHRPQDNNGCLDLMKQFITAFPTQSMMVTLFNILVFTGIATKKSMRQCQAPKHFCAVAISCNEMPGKRKQATRIKRKGGFDDHSCDSGSGFHHIQLPIKLCATADILGLQSLRSALRGVC